MRWMARDLCGDGRCCQRAGWRGSHVYEFECESVTAACDDGAGEDAVKFFVGLGELMAAGRPEQAKLNAYGAAWGVEFLGPPMKTEIYRQASCARVLMLSAAGDGGGGLGGFEVVAVAHDDGGADEQEEAGGDEELGAPAGAVPLLQHEAPEGGEDDDARPCGGSRRRSRTCPSWSGPWSRRRTGSTR